MMVEVGSYQFADQVGFKGWVAFEKYVVFEDSDGQIVITARR